MAPVFLWNAVLNVAKLSTVLQILLFLPLTLATLSKSAFLLLSLLLFTHSVIHGTLLFLFGPGLLSILQVPMHPFLLLLSFNAFSYNVSTILMTTAGWWGKILSWSGPGFIIMEALSSLLVAQKLGRRGRDLAGEGEAYQFFLLVTAAIIYVVSAWWVVVAYPSSASSPLSSTLLGVALTTLIFLTLIGFSLRRTNVVESAALTLFLAFNIWLAGIDNSGSLSDSIVKSAPLLSNILPHLDALVNFIRNTLPKPVLWALLYRLAIMHFASYILPTIGADAWETDSGVDNVWEEGRPTSKLAHILLTYRQSILVAVYSHLLLLDNSSQTWWRWISIFFTLIIWAVELTVSGDDPISKEWKVD